MKLNFKITKCCSFLTELSNSFSVTFSIHREINKQTIFNPARALIYHLINYLSLLPLLWPRQLPIQNVSIIFYDSFVVSKLSLLVHTYDTKANMIN